MFKPTLELVTRLTPAAKRLMGDADDIEQTAQLWTLEAKQQFNPNRGTWDNYLSQYLTWRIKDANRDAAKQPTTENHGTTEELARDCDLAVETQL